MCLKDLIERCKQGDARAKNEIWKYFEKYRPYANSLVGDPDEGYNALEDAYMKFIEKLPNPNFFTYQGNGQAHAFIKQQITWRCLEKLDEITEKKKRIMILTISELISKEEGISEEAFFERVLQGFDPIAHEQQEKANLEQQQKRSMELWKWISEQPKEDQRYIVAILEITEEFYKRGEKLTRNKLSRELQKQLKLPGTTVSPRVSRIRGKLLPLFQSWGWDLTKKRPQPKSKSGRKEKKEKKESEHG